MRDGAKTSGPSGHGTGDLRLLVALLLALAAGLSLLLAPSALAATVTDRPLLFSFDGSGTTAGAFPPKEGGYYLDAVAVDYSSGDVYAIDGANGAIDRFDAAGNAQNFSAGPAAGTSSLLGPSAGQPFTAQSQFFFSGFPDVAVDNSAVNPGRLYVSGNDGPIDAFDPQGSFLWTLPVAGACGITIDAAGHLWVGTGSNGNVLEFAASGSPPAQIGSFAAATGNKTPCRLGIDQSGKDTYIAFGFGSFGFGGPNTQKYVEGAFDSTLTSIPTRALAVDQSKAAGHVFTVERSYELGEQYTRLREYEPCAAPGCAGTQVPGSPFGHGLIKDSYGLAYNPSLDRLYVSDAGTSTVKAFGPLTTGTAPDVSTQPADGVTHNSATAHGTINPQGASNSYHFEWAKGGSEVQGLEVRAASGTFKVGNGGPSPQFTGPLPFNVSPAALQGALQALAPIGAGNVAVSGTPANGKPEGLGQTIGHYEITFSGALATVDVDQLVAQSIDLGDFPSPGAVIFTKTEGPDWSSAQSSPPQSIAPTDSADHAVSFAIGGLASDTAYQVRLVGANTANQLSSYSSPAAAFKTPPPPSPAVTNLSLSAISTSSAHLSATIDPQEDTTAWTVQRSTDPSCAGGFADLATQTISNPGPGTVAIAYDLSGLLPAQTYCVRISAKNGNPVATTADQVFQTLAVPPTGVFTAFAAPRADTTARINGYLNPEGEADVAYRFELSADGVNWAVLPDRVSSRDARERIVVADELTGLAPATTYHYRFGLVENSAGPAASLGAEKAFTTRASAEMALPGRGIELVNNPDKGNQNLGVGAAALDREKVVWQVTGGAPGGTTGAGAAFLAERTAGGWVSRNLIPPAAQQVEAEDGSYFLGPATPGLTKFIFATGAQLAPSGKTLVRLDANQGQDVLKAYEGAQQLSQVDITDDGAHVLLVEGNSAQPARLEDIGAARAGPPEVPAEVVSLLPDGSEPECGMVGEGQSFTGPGNEQGASGQWRPGYHRMAATDASRVYFQVWPNGKCGGFNPWWLLERNRDSEETLEVAPPGTSNALIRATPDGRSVFFLTDLALDPADTNSDVDVYRWDEEGEEDTCLTCVVADANLRIGNSSEAPVMVSDDSSHVYFESESQLTPQATQGQYNFYVLSGGTIRFVATPNSPLGQSSLARDRAELSADGNVLVFRTTATSNHELTADQLAASCPLPSGGGSGPCQELFRYDDRDGSLECLSCKHGGLTIASFGSPLPENNFKLSADGETVAFVTAQALVRLDVNNGFDLYEWRGGARRLITDGVSSFQQFSTAALQSYAVSANGRDILFRVVDPGLTGFEQDGFANLYDARVGGGFTPPSPPVHCSEDSCQGPLQAAPAAGHPGSATYSGPGNVRGGAPRPSCGRQRVRRHRRCVKRHEHRHRHHRRAAHSGQGRAK